SPKEPPFYMDGKGYGDPITQDTVFTFTYGVKATYAMVASENAEHTIGDGKNAVFTFKRNIDDEKTYGKFKTALMDGKAMPAGSHTTKEGSLILTLNNTYLDTLSAGKHTVTVKFEDGEAQATVTIKEAPPVPKTGDNGNPALWIGLMLLGLIGISGMAVTRKRSRR
ncbi:MAG: LPXTG cell wall anchor domain-containing protein, partial [Clostridia bacterium]|nr:LPXTG cell wall anchor domain-containing protein [Clostridia bacterium]